MIYGQIHSNYIKKEVYLLADTVILDSFSIVPGTFSIFIEENILSDRFYILKYESAELILRDLDLPQKALIPMEAGTSSPI